MIVWSLIRIKFAILQAKKKKEREKAAVYKIFDVSSKYITGMSLTVSQNEQFVDF